MKQKRSSAKPIISIRNNNSNEQVIAQIYFSTDSDNLDTEDKRVLDNVCTSLKTLNLRIGCFGDVWVFGGADHRGGSAHNLDLGKRRAAAIRKYIESKGIGAKVDSRSVGESKATQPTKHRPVSDSQLASDRRADVVLVLSVDKERIQRLEQRKKEILNLLKQAKDWETIRILGPLSFYAPGDHTKHGLTGAADWVKPKDGTIGSAMVSTIKAPVAAIYIMVSTPVNLLCDSVISIFQVARLSVLAAPPGAYLAVGKEADLRRLLDEVSHEIEILSTCQVRIHQ